LLGVGSVSRPVHCSKLCESCQWMVEQSPPRHEHAGSSTGKVDYAGHAITSTALRATGRLSASLGVVFLLVRVAVHDPGSPVDRSVFRYQ
jgi:hypothetical protein